MTTTHLALRTVPVPFKALVEAGLTPNQWCILYLMHHKYDAEMLAYLTGENSPKGWPAEDLNELHDRFYLIHEPNPNATSKTSPLNFRVSERFTDLLAEVLPLKKATAVPDIQKPVIAGMGLDKLEAFDELFAAYPSHILINGTLMSGRSGDYDSMADTYAKLLDDRRGRQGPSHLDILELLDWAKKNQLVNMGLAKFISGREWLGLAQLKESGTIGGTFDNSELL